MRTSSDNPAKTCRPRRSGFTLVEATVAMAITLLAASTLLLAIESTISAGDDSLDRVIAEGMADQLLEEIRHTHYMSPGSSPTQYPLGQDAGETSSSSRSDYDDSDDFHQYAVTPPKDHFGNLLGTGDGTGNLRNINHRLPSDYLERWRQRVEVYYVSPSDLSVRLPNGQTSDYRAAEVTIERADASNIYKTLAQRRFVYAYIPPGS